MTLAAADFDYIRALVHADSAMVLGRDKEYLVESRLRPVARDEGVRTIAELIRHLRESRAARLRHRVVEAMAITETSFFRDAGAFDALRDTVLPDLIGKRGRHRALDVWCGAASSGQEPYSVAMLLREALVGHPHWCVRVLASDLCREMIDRAREGTYSQQEVGRGVSTDRLTRHFRPTGDRWQVREVLRGMVECRVLNLDAPWPAMPRMDLILLRNVLIYFDLQTRRRILERVRARLRPDGYLVLGTSETTIDVDDGFEPVRVGTALVYRPR